MKVQTSGHGRTTPTESERVQDILEEIDPVLEPVLAKAFIKRGNQTLIAIGDKEVDYNPDFKLYITTKLSNPHYTPEVSTKAMILNFAVKVLLLVDFVCTVVATR